MEFTKTGGFLFVSLQNVFVIGRRPGRFRCSTILRTAVCSSSSLCQGLCHPYLFRSISTSSGPRPVSTHSWLLLQKQVGHLQKSTKNNMGSSVDENQDTTTGSQTEQSRSKLLFVKVTEHASTPTKGSKYSAGYDLKSAYDVIVPKRGSAVVKTDIQIQLPHGTYGRIAPRSGLAVKNKIDVGAGVVDEDYRGNLGVVLFNHGDEDFQVEKGDRIAQLICEKIEYPEILEVENLEVSDRGHNGFGSTGVKKIKLDGDVDVKSRETGEECAELQPKEVTMDVESGEVAVSVSSPVKEVKIGILSPSKLQPTAGTD